MQPTLTNKSDINMKYITSSNMNLSLCTTVNKFVKALKLNEQKVFHVLVHPVSLAVNRYNSCSRIISRV